MKTFIVILSLLAGSISFAAAKCPFNVTKENADFCTADHQPYVWVTCYDDGGFSISTNGTVFSTDRYQGPHGSYELLPAPAGTNAIGTHFFADEKGIYQPWTQARDEAKFVFSFDPQDTAQVDPILRSERVYLTRTGRNDQWDRAQAPIRKVEARMSYCNEPK
ncbi:MAG: hypothetical protein V4736_13175 [Bdellovibrionota bacterium]